jgi:hypothetical protein
MGGYIAYMGGRALVMGGHPRADKKGLVFQKDQLFGRDFRK